MLNTPVSIVDSKIKLRHKETYVTEGVNEKALAFPRGCYRGFLPRRSATPNTSLWLAIDPLSLGVDEDSFAIYSEYLDASNEGWALSVRETADVEIPIDAGFFPIGVGVNYLYVYIDAVYQIGSATVATYNVSDEDPYDSGSSNYDLDVILVGRIPVTPGDTTIDFDIASGSVLADVIAVRKYPIPTPDETGLTLSAGDAPLGLMTSAAAWATPTADQKKAMNNASSPDATNPFLTQDDILAKYLADPYSVTQSQGVVPTSIDITGDVYVGTGTLDQALQMFRLVDGDGNAPAYEDGGALRLLTIVPSGGGAPIDPSVDADANGFYSNPRLVFQADTNSTTGTIDMTVWMALKKTSLTTDQTPVKKTPITTTAHAENVPVKRSLYPPGWDRRVSVQDVQDALVREHESNRGVNPLLRTDEHVAARAFWRKDMMIDGVPSASYIQTISTEVRYLTASRRASDGHTVLIYAEDDALLRIIEYSPESYNPALNLKDFTDLLTLDITTIFTEVPAWDWYITGMCCDGQNIYLRLRDTDLTGSGIDRHRVFAVTMNQFATGVSIKSGWGSSGVSLGSGTAVENHIPFADDIIVADDDNLATCDNWTDMRGVGTPGGIFIVPKDGTAPTLGAGDIKATIAGGTPGALTPAAFYGVGPLVSNGEQVFALGVATTSNSDPNMYMAFHVNISDPTTVSVANWYGVARAWNDTKALVTGMEWDGDTIWIFGMGSSDSSAVTITLFDASASRQYNEIKTASSDGLGGTCFDGVNFWVMRDGDGTDRPSGSPWLDKVPVGTFLKYSGYLGSSGFDASSNDAYEATVRDRFAVGSPGALIPTDWSRNRPVFDGENIWIAPESDLGGPDIAKIFRISAVKGRG